MKRTKTMNTSTNLLSLNNPPKRTFTRSFLILMTLLPLFFISLNSSGQTLFDSFADGDFTASPVWGGNTTLWSIVPSSDAAAGATGSNTLRLNGPATSQTDYLSSQVATWSTSQEWGFFLGRRAQAFTASNQAYFWLYSTTSTLNSTVPTGYRIAIGDDTGGDDFRLEYVVNGVVSLTVITSTGAITNGLTDIGVLVRVTRSASGVWTLFTSALPTVNGTGAIATDIPNATNASVNQGSATNNTVVPAANGYLGVAALHSTGANAIISTEFDQIYFTPAASNPNIAISSAHPAASNINQGSADNIIGGISLAVTTANAVLTSVTVNTSGTYTAATDLTNIKFYLSNSATSISGATQLGLTQPGVVSGGAVSVSGLTASVTSGSTGYILVTASISATATVNRTVSLGSTAFSNLTFSGTPVLSGTNPVAAGISPTNDQTIVGVTPIIALADFSPVAGTINQNTTNNILKSVQVTVSTASATLNSIAFTTGGSYLIGDLQANGFKVWINSTNNLVGATQLGASQAIVASGGNISISGLTQSFPVGTRYLLVTADVAYNAGARNILIGALPAGNISFSVGNPTGVPVPAGNLQSFGAVTPIVTMAVTSLLNGIVSFPTANAILYRFTLANTINHTDLTQLTITTAGTYSTTDLDPNSFKLWYNTSNTLTGATQIGTSQAVVASGGTITFSGLSQNILAGSTGFFFVTIDVATGATMGNTINIISNTLASTIQLSQGTLTGLDPTKAGGALLISPVPTVTEVILPQYAVNGTTAAHRLQYACRLTLNNLLPNATYRYFTGASELTTTTTGTTAGNFFAINNAPTANGYIVGQSSTKSMGGVNGALMGGDEFVATGRYAELVTNATGSYTGWFAMAPTGNTTFNAGKANYFYVQLNNGAGDTVLVQSVRTTNTFMMINPATGTNGGQAIKGTSSGIPENMVFLYDNVAATGRPIYGTWLENDGISENYTTWYAAPATLPVDGVNGSWGAYIPVALANGIRCIEQRNIATAAVEGCSATSATGVWPTGSVNTVNPTGGTTPLVISSTDASFVCPILNTISTNAISPLTYCVDGNVSVPVTVTFNPSIYPYNSANIFTAQLSNASGSFASPTNIGTVATAASSTTINAFIPPGMAAGTNYRIRVISSLPPITGTNNGANITFTSGTTFYADGDGDTYGNLTNTNVYCSSVDAAAAGYISNSTDCDDFDAAVNPAATEVCNTYDDDCDGLIDEGVQLTFYEDFDGDTYGKLTSTILGCTAPFGYVSNSTDCNDLVATINPGVTELCNGFDDNCNTIIDEGCTIFTFFADADGDTYGNPASFVTSTINVTPLGYVTNNLDCNDNPTGGAAFNPLATEICNSLDDNCNGTADEGLTFLTYYQDFDNDTYGNINVTTSACSLPFGYVLNGTDCDDNNNLVAPLPPVAISGATSFCTGGSTTLNAGTGSAYGGYTNYLWSTGSVNQTINVTTAGTYTVTITGVAGCTNSATVVVTVNPLPTVTISGSSNVCTGTNTTLDAGAGFSSYLWSTSAVSQTISVNTGGTYTVTVTNANGCTKSASKTLVAAAPPVVTLTTTNVSCNGGSNGAISTTATNACTNGPGLVISRFLPNPAGLDNANEFVELLATRDINFATTPYSVVFANNGTGTTNGWIAGGTTTYGFNITTGTAVAGQLYYVGGSTMTPVTNRLRAINIVTTGGDVFGTVGGTGGVVGNGGTSADGVAVFAQNLTTVTSSTVPVDAWLVGTTLGSAVVSAGAAGYQLPVNDLYPGGKIQSTSLVVANATTENLAITAAGTFNPGTGAFVTARTFTSVLMTGFIAGNNPTVNGNGLLSLTTGFTYQWSNAATTKSISGLAANAYSVTVTSCNGCTASFSSTVTQPNAIAISQLTNTPANCSNTATGALAVSVSGGTPTYTYNWNNGSISSSISSLLPGNFTVTVTDANGCTAQATFTVGFTTTAILHYADLDNDTYGSILDAGTLYCVAPAFTSLNKTDCNDGAFAVNPGATEVCNTIDDDCDGLTDDLDPSVTGRSLYYTDADNDSYGSSSSTGTLYCFAPALTSLNNTDCNDAINSVNPGATEVCNGIDDNCNTLIDDADPTVSGGSLYYTDADNDGYGSSSSTGALYCIQPPLTSINNTDCNDAVFAINPGVSEVCGNGIDDNCNTLIDELCPTNVTLNLTMFIQGFYLGGNAMTPALVNTGVSTDPLMLEVDTVVVELHDALSPFNMVETDTQVLKVGGTVQLNYSSAILGGSYYIVVKHRNSMETWSKDPVTFSSITTFDFAH